MKAEGYETPYAFEGWFYGRKRCPVRKGDTVEVGWTETLTCGMKRH